MSRPIDLSGRRYGRLTVLCRSGRQDKNGRSYWECECDCGNRTTVHRGNLVYGRTTSCGCLKQELAVKNATTHDEYGTRLYRIWSGIHTRCYNKDVPSYARYGGRGIVVCDEWRSDFTPFYKWAVENGYSDNLTLDRIDNNGPYSPENCRWATHKQQASNTRKTVRVTFQGETKSLSEWAEITGISRLALWKRICLRGWAVEKALSTPLFNNGYIKNKEDL